MRQPIRCSECVTPAAYRVSDGGREYIEIKSHHHGRAHLTRIPLDALDAVRGNFSVRPLTKHQHVVHD